MLPRVEANHGRMTFAYVGDFIDQAGRMTSADVLDAFQRGHEIAAHSQTHPDMLTKNSLTRQTEWGVRTAIDTLIGEGNCTSWIYPVSSRSQVVDYEAYGRYGRVFWGIDGQFIVPSDSDVFPYAVGRFSWTDDTHEQALELVRLASARPVRITIYNHYPTNLTQAHLYELIDLCNELDVPMVTLSE